MIINESRQPGVSCPVPSPGCRNVGLVPQIALNPAGGPAARVQARVADADIGRLATLAAQLGIRPSTLARRALLRGLADLERSTGPPDPGG
jgi:hypothetical protein